MPTLPTNLSAEGDTQNNNASDKHTKENQPDADETKMDREKSKTKKGDISNFFQKRKK